MLGRRTSFVALAHEPGDLPLAHASSLSRGVVGASGYMIGYVYKNENTFSSSTVIWEKSTDEGGSFTVVTDDSGSGGDYAITYTDVVEYGGTGTGRWRGKTVLTISNLESADYGLYRIKAVHGSNSSYSKHNFDFSNPV
tara:strand:- start:45 stop:461 length:417 start_codon:yes stop_codon:yes gene_type:complete